MKRYDINEDGSLTEAPCGHVVRYDDIGRLLLENDGLAAAVARLSDNLKESNARLQRALTVRLEIVAHHKEAETSVHKLESALRAIREQTKGLP